MICPSCGNIVPITVSHCSCGFDLEVSDDQLREAERLAEGRKFKRIGIRLTAVGIFVALCLVIALSSVQEQLHRFAMLNERIEALSNEKITPANIAKQLQGIYDTGDAIQEARKKTKEEWDHTSSGVYIIAAFCCYLTAFSAPEEIRKASKFWPGIVEVCLFLVAGIGLYKFGKSKAGVTDNEKPTTLDLSS